MWGRYHIRQELTEQSTATEQKHIQATVQADMLWSQKPTWISQADSGSGYLILDCKVR